MTITKSQAVISAATIDVKVLRVGKRQMTQSVFRQLPSKQIIEVDQEPKPSKPKDSLQECDWGARSIYIPHNEKLLTDFLDSDEGDLVLDDDSDGFFNDALGIADDLTNLYLHYGMEIDLNLEWGDIIAKLAARIRQAEEEVEKWATDYSVTLLGVPWGLVSYTWKNKVEAWATEYVVWSDSNRLYRSPLASVFKMLKYIIEGPTISNECSLEVTNIVRSLKKLDQLFIAT